MGLGVWDVGFGVRKLRFRVWGLGLGDWAWGAWGQVVLGFVQENLLQGLGLGVGMAWFKVNGLGFRVLVFEGLRV